jgi:hypothetical protein
VGEAFGRLLLRQVLIGATVRRRSTQQAFDLRGHDMVSISRPFTIVLADVKPLEIGIWPVFPTRRHMPARVRAFIDAWRDRVLAAADAASNVTRRATPPGDERQIPGHSDSDEAATRRSPSMKPPCGSVVRPVLDFTRRLDDAQALARRPSDRCVHGSRP